MNLKRKKSNKKRGENFEHSVKKTVMSGGLWFAPLDLDYKDFCIECKVSDKKGYRITTELLEKMWGQSLQMNKEPVLIIGIKRNDTQMFTLHCKINIERKGN